MATDAAADERPSFTNAFGFGALSFLVSGVLALASSILTARIYGITVIGEFALAYAPTGAVWFLSSVREQPALIRMLAPLKPRSPRVTGLFVPVFIFSSCLTLIASAVAAGATYLLFQGPIEESATDREDVVIAITETLIHEIGHFFGLSEEEIEAIEDQYWHRLEHQDDDGHE